MSDVELADRIALLLAIKESGTTVPFDHIIEKVGRDVRFLEHRDVDRQEVLRALRRLIDEGSVEERKGEYSPLARIDPHVERLIDESEGGLNRSYVMVWLAKKYYPHAGRLMLPFLEGRPVSAIKIFSGKGDPIRMLETIFVRYSRYKPKPQLLTVDSEAKLMTLVYDHCIDFVPYVHKLDSKMPDTFVLDLDAGTRIVQHPRAFDFMKMIAHELSALLMEAEVEPMVKFSGSRGFQVWAYLDDRELPPVSDYFRLYREIAVAVQRRLEDRLVKKLGEINASFPEIVDPSAGITTSVVARKEERASQVLVDWSSMKAMGDVRAPFSLHYKTGLVSVPIEPDELVKFAPQDAKPLEVVKHLDRYERAARLIQSSPKGLLP